MTILLSFIKAIMSFLIVITLLAIVFQTFGPEKILVLGQDSDIHIESINDRGNNGKSVATLTRDGDKFIIDCEITPSDYQWPYCKISFSLIDKNGEGMDLSTYEQIKLWAKYSEPQAFGMRLQLSNFNPTYSRTDDSDSLKYNSIELFDTHQRYPQVINMSNMQAATGWLSERKIAADYWGPEFNDVRAVQVSTGENVTPGNYQIIIERIEISGKYISDRGLYRTLVKLWAWGVALIFFIFVTALIIIREDVRKTDTGYTLRPRHPPRTHDPLTGLLNRYGLDPLFSKYRNSDGTQLLSLIFIDIDHFKNINDSYGHNTGDQVLQALSRALKTNIRTQDSLARWGGEEFLLACPDTTLENALELAEKLRRALEEHEWPQNLQVTASFGVAQLLPQESPTELFARADKALYTAKTEGRNCVRASTQEAVA